MANIALLNRCNLRCPYCFADSYIADEKEDISIDTFNSLLNFCAYERELGIIGGEPLLHKDFDTILEILNGDYRFNTVTVFTNGIFIEKHIESLLNSRVRLLINVNSKSDIGNANFEKIDSGIKKYFDARMDDRISLGINVYKEGQDFDDICYLLEKYGIKKLRVSLVIPKDKSEGGIKYFLRMKQTLLSLYKRLKSLGVSPFYDCNAIPWCVYTKEETELLESLNFENQFEREIFLGKRSVCSPVIDIYPDMTATRCFGCYDMARVDVRDFKNIQDLKNYFFMEIDANLVHNYSYERCKDCYNHKVFGCFGGCLCYKEK